MTRATIPAVCFNNNFGDELLPAKIFITNKAIEQAAEKLDDDKTKTE